MSVLDKKGSQLDPAETPRQARWAAFEPDGAGGWKDVFLTTEVLRPGVSAVGVRLAMTPTQLQTVLDALPADQTSEVHIRWFCGARVQEGDALYTFIQATLGLSGPSMDGLMNNAATFE